MQVVENQSHRTLACGILDHQPSGAEGVAFAPGSTGGVDGQQRSKIGREGRGPGSAREALSGAVDGIPSYLRR